MKKHILLLALVLVSIAAQAQNALPRNEKAPITAQGELPLPGGADVLEVAKKMMDNNGLYESDINGAFARMLRKQLRNDTMRVTLKGQVLEKLPDGCVWAEFTARTPDNYFTSYVKNRYLVKGPFEMAFRGRFCDDPNLYSPDNN